MIIMKWPKIRKKYLFKFWLSQPPLCMAPLTFACEKIWLAVSPAVRWPPQTVICSAINPWTNVTLGQLDNTILDNWTIAILGHVILNFLYATTVLTFRNDKTKKFYFPEVDQNCIIVNMWSEKNNCIAGLLAIKKFLPSFHQITQPNDHWWCTLFYNQMTTGDAPYGQFLVEIICKAVSGEPPLASCSQYNLNILPISSRFSRVEPVPLVKPPALIFAVPHNTPLHVYGPGNATIFGSE